MAMRCLPLSWGSQWASLVIPGTIYFLPTLHHSWHEHFVISRLVSQLQGERDVAIALGHDWPAGSWLACLLETWGRSSRSGSYGESIDAVKNSFTNCNEALDCRRGMSRKRHLLDMCSSCVLSVLDVRHRHGEWLSDLFHGQVEKKRKLCE